MKKAIVLLLVLLMVVTVGCSSENNEEPEATPTLLSLPEYVEEFRNVIEEMWEVELELYAQLFEAAKNDDWLVSYNENINELKDIIGVFEKLSVTEGFEGLHKEMVDEYVRMTYIFEDLALDFEEFGDAILTQETADALINIQLSIDEIADRMYKTAQDHPDFDKVSW